MTYDPIQENSFIPTFDNITKALERLSVQLVCEQLQEGELNARDLSNHDEVMIPADTACDFINNCNSWDKDVFDCGCSLHTSMNSPHWEHWLKNYEHI